MASAEAMHEGFIKNEGQLTDQNGQVNHQVKFIFDGGGFHLQLKKNGFSYEWISGDTRGSNQSEAGTMDDEEEDPILNTTVTTHRVDIVFSGANRNPALIATEKTFTVFNYYLPVLKETGLQNVPSYKRITYQNLYDGIDLVFNYDASNKISPLEYSFTIHPGADAAAIKMQYRGANGISITGDGELNLLTSLGEVAEKSLHCFTEENSAPLPIKRFIHNGFACFQTITSQDQTIIIDPNIVWSSYYGGNSFEYISEVSVDKQNKVIIGGYTESNSNIATAGAYQVTYSGKPDMFVAKFKVNGIMEWATYLGGSEEERAYGVITDKNSNIILSGRSKSGTDITTSGAYQEANNGLFDIILAKFNKSGALLWCTLLGGPKVEEVRQAITDAKGNLYAAGYTESSTLIKVSNKNPSTYSAAGDAIMVKFSPSGFPSWTAYYGGTGQDRAHGIALDQFGNIIVEGTTESPAGIATSDVHQMALGGDSDAFLAKFDSTGNLFWGTYYGGSEDDHGRGVISDMKSAIYIVGFGSSAHSFGTSATYQPNINSFMFPGGYHREDGFIAKFKYNGTRVWGSYYGGEEFDQILGIDRSESGYLFVAGMSTSVDSISTPGAFEENLTASENGFIGKFDTLGNLLYGSYLGGDNDEGIEDLCYDENNLYLAMTSSGGLPITPGTWQTTYEGNEDASVYRFYMGDDCYDQYEPNETQSAPKLLNASADPLILYGSTGSISSSNDKDWFKVKTKNTQRNLKIIITDLTKDYSVQLFNGIGNLIASSIPQDNGDQNLIYNGAGAATYYFQIAHDLSNYDPNNCYRVISFISDTPFSSLFGKQFNIENENNDIAISLYPNPAKRDVAITGSCQSDESATVSVYNMMNVLVYREKITLAAGIISEKIELPALSAGNYIFEWKQRGAFHREKLVIQ